MDLVIYTHGHGDHYSKATALALFKGSGPYIAIDPALAGDLKNDIPGEKLGATESGRTFSAGDITLDALEGKHIGPIMLFRVTIDGIRIFHGGDSGYVPLGSMASHIAFVPTGVPSPTCSPEYAFQMVADVKPQIAVPFHGWDNQHAAFKELTEKKLPETKVVVSKPYVARKVTLIR